MQAAGRLTPLPAGCRHQSLNHPQLFFICLMSKCDCASTLAHANECKGWRVPQVEMNTVIFQHFKKAPTRNVLRVLQMNFQK